MMTKTFFYLRDPKKRPFGTVALIQDGSNVRVGVSLCRNDDPWDRRRGQDIAFGRASRPTALILHAEENPTLADVLARLKSSRDRDLAGVPLYRQQMVGEELEKTWRVALQKVRLKG